MRAGACIRRAYFKRKEMCMVLDMENMRRELALLAERLSALPGFEGMTVGHDRLLPGDEAALDAAARTCWHDVLSDIDAHVCLRMAREDIAAYATSSGAERLGFARGDVLGMCISGGETAPLYRVVRRDGMRFDLSLELICDDAISPSGIAPYVEREVIDAGRYWPRPTERQIDAFWFVQVQALGKLLRGDYLIADHLTNCQVNETLVMQMRMRDDAAGTNVHRYGGRESLAYRSAHAPKFFAGDDTARSIADRLAAAAIAFDELTVQLCPDYVPRAECFFAIWRAYEAALGA